MSPEVMALLDARKAHEEASASERAAESQLALATDRWLEARPDRIRSFLDAYRERRAGTAAASRAALRAERAAVDAGVLCDVCGGLDEHHDVDCAASASRAA